MELPAIKLVIAAGPRKGETLEFQPGSAVRLGRIARGNNVTIKDSGISSKHLQIGSESGKWTIQDLDSSNGTVLNSTKLTPFTPSDLIDGDTIKLGEFTSITVHFGDFPSKLRRNPKRKASEAEIKEKSEIPLQNEEKPRRGKARRVKALDSVPEVEKESENSAAVAEEPQVTANCLISDNELENRGGGAVKPEPESVNVRVTRSRRNMNSLNSENLGESLNVRVTRSRKNNNGLISENLGEDCAKITRGVRGRRKKLPELPVDEAAEGAEKKEELDNEGKGEDAGAGVSVNEADAQKRAEDTEKSKPIDLEKMTLGEWFDFMEVYIPKQIIETTEKMIEEMRRKAERVHQYMIEQKKAKGLEK